ncbi:MAG: threonine--tRNA ligase [bacterium]
MEKAMSDLERLRHTGAHILAQAVKRLYPTAKLAIGPPIEEGFYYDFGVERPFTDEDLKQIEDEMYKISKEGLKVEHVMLPRSEAMNLLKDEPYKLELMQDIPDDPVSFYKQGEFTDLCRGAHVETTSKVKHFKVLNASGAYWRGDEKRPMLQRIYATAFFTQEELDANLKLLEEIEKRDHRRLGRELELFTSFPDEAGPGLIFYLPKGVVLRRILEDLNVREHLKRGYQQVMTPHLMKSDVWKTSGHWDNYRENMFIVAGGGDSRSEEDIFGVKPMNCPGHMLMYQMKRHSYRDLPLRIYELGTVYRYERGGTMHGLMRVRGFTQDDAHIFTPIDLLEDEITGVLEFTKYLLGVFGFQFEWVLSGKPEQAMGADEIWEKALKALENSLNRLKVPFDFHPSDGAFYGPKIDVYLKDALGRSWQGPTIQCDFNFPERFNLTFVNKEDKEERPVMIHRAIYGSFERFLGVLIEHYAGKFPLWLSPVQARVLPISEKAHDYAIQVAARLREAGVRVENDARNEKLGYKIREAQLQRIPYALVVGEREAQSGQVAVREREAGDLGAMPLDAFILKIKPDLAMPASS